MQKKLKKIEKLMQQPTAWPHGWKAWQNYAIEKIKKILKEK